MFYLMFNHRAGLRQNNLEFSRAVKQIQCVVGYVVVKLNVVDQQKNTNNLESHCDQHQTSTSS